MFCCSISCTNFWWDMRFMCELHGRKNNHGKSIHIEGSVFLASPPMTHCHWFDLSFISKFTNFSGWAMYRVLILPTSTYMSRLWTDRDFRRHSYLWLFIWVHAWNKSEQTVPNIEQKRKQLTLDFWTCWGEIWPVFWTQSDTALNFGLIMVTHNTVKPAVKSDAVVLQVMVYGCKAFWCNARYLTDR